MKVLSKKGLRNISHHEEDINSYRLSPSSSISELTTDPSKINLKKKGLLHIASQKHDARIYVPKIKNVRPSTRDISETSCVLRSKGSANRDTSSLRAKDRNLKMASALKLKKYNIKEAETSFEDIEALIFEGFSPKSKKSSHKKVHTKVTVSKNEDRESYSSLGDSTKLENVKKRKSEAQVNRKSNLKSKRFSRSTSNSELAVEPLPIPKSKDNSQNSFNKSTTKKYSKVNGTKNMNGGKSSDVIASKRVQPSKRNPKNDVLLKPSNNSLPLPSVSNKTLTQSSRKKIAMSSQKIASKKDPSFKRGLHQDVKSKLRGRSSPLPSDSKKSESYSSRKRGATSSDEILPKMDQYDKKGLNSDVQCKSPDHGPPLPSDSNKSQARSSRTRIAASGLKCSKIYGTDSQKSISFEEIEKKIFAEELPNKASGYHEKKVNDSLNTNKKLKRDRSKSLTKPPQVNLKKKEAASSDSEENDWEEVDELDDILLAGKDTASSNVQIELKESSALWGANKRKRRSHQELVEDYIRKKINRTIKLLNEEKHKVHLLCLLAHAKHVNFCLNLEHLMACGLSMVDPKFSISTKIEINDVVELLKEFRKSFTYIPERLTLKDSDLPIEELILKRFSERKACSIRELVFLFIIVCRSLGIMARLVFNMLPIPWKTQQKDLIKPKKTIEEDIFEETGKKSPQNLPETNSQTSKQNKNFYKVISSDSESPDLKKGAKSSNSKKMKNKDKKSKVRETSSDEDFEDDVDYRSPKKKPKNRRTLARETKKQASSPNNSLTNKGKPENLLHWIEVYDYKKMKWFSIEVVKQTVNECHAHISERIPTNSAYILAFNQDGSLIDVTKRYVSNWLTTGRKLRCDNNWWVKALVPFISKTPEYLKEEKQLDDDLQLQPLPKTISGYKDHPLYVLQRHLLKYQAIYPPDESPVGFFRQEPVFPRFSVKTLRGRENWIREAKTVIVDEEPYKIVNAIPKWDRVNRVVIKDRPLELFGEWQVEDFVPPTAKNGKVPRNEFGNVDLFKPSMLPFGCVHLQVTGINRVARKMGIDCAPAVIGFEFGSTGCHPLMDGFIVCEEHKDILMDAWEQDRVEQEKKQEEKRLKQIYGNWKKLIHGLMVKEKIKEKYGGSSQNIAEETKAPKSKKRKVTQKEISELEESSTSTPVPLSIDTETLASDVTKDRLEKMNQLLHPTKMNGRTKTASHKKSSKNTLGNSIAETLSSESEDEAAEEERKQKIRNILQWEPTCGTTLSDQSDQEDNKEEKCVLSSEDEISRPLHQSKVKKAKSKISRPKKKTTSLIQNGSEDSDSTPNAVTADRGQVDTTSNRRQTASKLTRSRASLRTSTRNAARYTEISDCELSDNESDDDRSYIPLER